jgi:Flp pilus assembly protein TadG
MRALARLMSRFRRDRRGNVAVIFIFASVPLIAAIGGAIDYGEAVRMKSKLQSAADAAAIASISQQSPGWLAASQMSGNGVVTAAQNAAMQIFNGNISGLAPRLLTLNAGATSATVTKTGQNVTSTVTFSANVPVNFIGVLNVVFGGGTRMPISQFTVTGSSTATATLPLYIDFYVAVDVSSSMGLPSTTAEATRMQSINPDNWVQYRTGCTLACHFAPQNSACKDPPVTPPTAPNPNPATNAAYSQQYNTNNYCMGYIYSRLSQTALSNLLNATPASLTDASHPTGVPKQVPGLPAVMISTLNNSMSGSNSLLTGNAASTTWSLPPVSSCPTAGTDACIQLRLDAVGVALNATQAVNGIDGLFATAVNPQYEQVNNQFRIGLYPFITLLDLNYSPLTYTINGNPNTPGTINYAAANLASELDTNINTNLGSGGTHIDVALHTLNGSIATVGTGSSTTNTQPWIFLITDGAQDPQSKGVPNGGWSGSNHATTLDNASNSFPTICTTMKNRGIKISVLNIPYQPINPVNASFAGDEDDAANNNIPNIPTSLKNCATPPDAQGVGYYYEASTPDQITAALKAMFQHVLATAHLTN